MAIREDIVAGKISVELITDAEEVRGLMTSVESRE
jgi:hypothetical protein